MSYNTQKPERFIQNIIDAATMSGLAFVKSYSATKDIVLTFTDPKAGGADALLKIITIAQTGNNQQNPVTGLVSEVYVPHILQVGFSGGTKATATALLAAQTAGVHATNSATLNAVVAGNTLTVNGVVFTAVAGAPGVDQFQVGGTDAVTATNLAAAINASNSAGVLTVVYAEAAAAVVNLWAQSPGVAGNALTLAGTAVRFVVFGANFALGVDGDTLVIDSIPFEVVDSRLPASVKPYEVPVGASEAATIASLVQVFNLTFVGITAAIDGTTPEQANFSVDVPGTGGNARTITDVGAGFTPSGAGFFASGSDVASSTLLRAYMLALGLPTGITTDLYEVEGTFVEGTFVPANLIKSFRGIDIIWGNLASM